MTDNPVKIAKEVLESPQYYSDAKRLLAKALLEAEEVILHYGQLHYSSDEFSDERIRSIAVRWLEQYGGWVGLND